MSDTRRVIKRVFLLSLLAVVTESSEVRAQRLLGTTAPVTSSVSNAVKVLPEARIAIVYDTPEARAVRVRVLDESGQLTPVPRGILRNTLFDEFEWSAREQTFYALSAQGPLYRWNKGKRAFELIGGRPFQFRAMRYIPRLGKLLLVGKEGLSVIREGRIVPVRSAGIQLRDLYYIRDSPKYAALLLGNDQEQYLRAADGRVHKIGQGGIDRFAELGSRPAIQLVGPKVAFDIGLVRGHGGAWSPGRIKRVNLAWGVSGMLRSFVPTLDSFIIGQSGFFDWLLRRSGFYRLGPDGLTTIGDSRQRGTKFPNHISLPSKKLDLLQLDRRPTSPTEFWAINSDGTMLRKSWPNRAGRHFNVFENEAITYLSGASGVWFWNGREQPRRIASYQFAQVYSLPLTRELLLTDGKTAVAVGQSGRVVRLPRFATGDVLQANPDRLIVIGRNILEFDLPSRS